ncbi:MAG: von Willebrand factor type A domain-containing protein [Deltaproteobacteria bacterium]|nr:von Willebrand factor type A domain-containing protein [Deltaproteobacteria bacterium]
MRAMRTSLSLISIVMFLVSLSACEREKSADALAGTEGGKPSAAVAPDSAARPQEEAQKMSVLSESKVEMLSVRRKEARPKKSRALAGGAPSMPMPAVGSGMIAKDKDGDGTEQYVDHGVRQWEDASKDALSTFSIDVDTASYTIARRKLREGHLPPASSVRTEEFINYFTYNYAPPTNAAFSVSLEATPSPFEKNLTLLRVGIKGREVTAKTRKPVHLTFLVDISGSMTSRDKMGLVKQSLRFLLDQLQDGDTVALCTYAGAVREVLPPTPMEQRAKIHAALENLKTGGSTAMGSGLQLAYKLAYTNFKGNSVNRVIVCSDGDANVGRTEHGSILDSIKHYAEEGVTLSTIGFGMGNYKDHRMEQLANKGNGNYFYIDTIDQAKRIFGEKMMGTLQVIAKDVKIQVEFDPKAVKKYRLVGYENRDIADKDFRNDKVDAGEIGAGHTVTALYEVDVTNPKVAWATVRVRWKKPQGVKAAEKAFPINPSLMKKSFEETGPDFKRAVSAAALAENLRKSPFAESWTMAKARALAQKALSRENKEELELIELIDKSATLMGKKP